MSPAAPFGAAGVLGETPESVSEVRVFGARNAEMPTESDRLTIRLSPAAKEAVEEIQRLGGFKTPQEAIRRAIGDERFLQQKQDEGWEILLRKGKDYRTLVWPT